MRLDEINEAISHLANAYLLINGVRADSMSHNIMLRASMALVHISQAQDQAFQMKVELEQGEDKQE